MIEKYVIVTNNATAKLSFEGTRGDFIEFAKQHGYFQDSESTLLIGPFYDGGTVRYEDESTYALLSS